MSLKRGSVPQFDDVASAQVTVGTSAAALTSLNLEPSGLATLQADPTNTGNITLGNSSHQSHVLTPGTSFPFLVPVTNLSVLFAVASASGQKLNALAFR